MRPASHHDRLFNLRCLASAIALGAAIFVANAQGPGQPPPPPPGGGDTGGPPVPPGANEGDGDFGGAGKPGRRQGGAAGGAARERMQSGRAWMMTWNGMKASLTDDQRAKAEQIEKDFRVKEEAWRKENGEKMKALADAARSSGGAPDPQTAQQLSALNDSRPKRDEVQKQIFGVLTPEQQETFKKSLAANEAALKEQAGKRGPGGKGGKPGGAPPPPKDGEGAPPPPPMDQ